MATTKIKYVGVFAGVAVLITLFAGCHASRQAAFNGTTRTPASAEAAPGVYGEAAGAEAPPMAHEHKGPTATPRFPSDVQTETLTSATYSLPEPKAKTVRLFYATDRKRTGSPMAVKFYGGGRTPQSAPLEYGICNVTIPTDHQFAKLESYSWLKFELKNNPEKHVTLVSVTPKAEKDFFGEMHSALGKSSKKEIFIFIHGYNNTWEYSARRAAQIAYDIGLDENRGVPLLFSWPSQGKLLDYVKDEANIRVSKFHLANLITNVIAQSGAEKINVLAHSMGNQALAEALDMIGARMPAGENPLLNQVVMAAPDVDVDQLLNASTNMVRVARHVTIYSCKSDLPVLASKWFHGDLRRVGSFAVIPGFDTIDATKVQTDDILDHSYFGDVPVVLRDVRKLFECGGGVDARCCCCFTPMKENDQSFWAFLPGTISECSHLKSCD